MSSLAPPDANMRAAIDVQRKEMRDALRAEVVVLPGGFVAATVRSLMAGITLIQRPQHPTKVVASVEEASQFLAGVFDSVNRTDAPTAAELRAVADEIRATTARV